MLVELSVMEQRYHVVMEVICGAPVTKVAGSITPRSHRPWWAFPCFALR